MSEWLLVLTPIIILLIVLQLGGSCAFSGTGPVGPSQSYPDTAAGISGLVAFWNLDETTGTLAKDSQGVDAGHPNGGNPGTYIQPVQLFYNGGDKSAAAPGTLSLGGQSLSSNGGGPAVSFNGATSRFHSTRRSIPQTPPVSLSLSESRPDGTLIPPSQQLESRSSPDRSSAPLPPLASFCARTPRINGSLRSGMVRLRVC